jgi:hypothetical protein
MYCVEGAYSQALCDKGGSRVARVALAVMAGALTGSTVAYRESKIKVSKSSRTISMLEGRWRNGARYSGARQEKRGGRCLFVLQKRRIRQQAV